MRCSRFAGLIAIAAATVAGVRAQPSEWFLVKTIGPNVFAAIDNPAAKQRSYSNAGFIVGDDGVIVVDTLTSDQAGKALLAAIRAVTSLPVTFVVNTHYHGDHVAGNTVFTGAGAAILAHRDVRGWIHQENLRMLGPNPNPDLKQFIERLAPPTVTYTGGIDLHAGNRVIQVREFPGHTGGDSVVIVPDARVVFGGDLVWRGVVPNMIDASTTPWIATLDTLVSAHPGYTFVPGHGDIPSIEQVRGFRDYLSTVHTLVADARAKDSSIDAITRTVVPQLRARFGSWEGFEFLAPLNVSQIADELSGKKSVPPPVR